MQAWGEGCLGSFPSDNETFKRLSKFYRANGTVPLSEAKHIIKLFRKMIQLDSYVEELAKTKAQHSKIDHREETSGRKKKKK